MELIKKAIKNLVSFLRKQVIKGQNLLHNLQAWRKNCKRWIHRKVWITRINWESGIIQARCKVCIKEHWDILIIGGVILVILALIFPSYFLWIIELLLTFGTVYLFRPQIFPLKRDTLVKMDNIIKYTGVIGFILFIHFLFGDHSVLTLIDYAFKQLSLFNSRGYVVGSILGFTAILWGFQIANERLTAFHQQIEASYNHNFGRAYRRERLGHSLRRTRRITSLDT